MRYSINLLFIQLICKGVLKFCLRDMLGEQQRKTLFYFLDMLSLLLSESCKKSEVKEIESKLNVSLALMERDFPMTLQVMYNFLFYKCIRLCTLLCPNFAGYHDAFITPYT